MLLKHYSLGQDTWHALSLTLLTPVISFFLLSIYWQHYDKLNVLVLVWVFLYLNMFHQSLHFRNALYMKKVADCRTQKWFDISIKIKGFYPFWFILFKLEGKTDSGNLLICFADYWSNTQIWQDRYATLRQIRTKDK